MKKFKIEVLAKFLNSLQHEVCADTFPQEFMSRWNITSEDYFVALSGSHYNIVNQRLQDRPTSKSDLFVLYNFDRKARGLKNIRYFQCRHVFNQSLACNKVFTDQQKFYDHLRAHTGEKPFECLTCGKCFSQPGSLQNHIQRKHLVSVKNWIKRGHKCNTRAVGQTKQYVFFNFSFWSEIIIFSPILK